MKTGKLDTSFLCVIGHTRDSTVLPNITFLLYSFATGPFARSLAFMGNKWNAIIFMGEEWLEN